MSAYNIQIPQLAGGPHSIVVFSGPIASPPIPFTVIAEGLFTSQTGLTFNAAQNGPASPAQTFNVLSGSGTANFSAAASTVNGGSWLSMTPSSGTATFGTAGTTLQVRANPTGLTAGTYYGRVTITATDPKLPPQNRLDRPHRGACQFARGAGVGSNRCCVRRRYRRQQPTESDHHDLERLGVVVPSGVASNDATNLTMSISGQESSAVTSVRRLVRGIAN